jgi:3-oxoacyl-[acyl-carrier-protein] synthase III
MTDPVEGKPIQGSNGTYTNGNGTNGNGYHAVPAAESAPAVTPEPEFERRYAQIIGWGYHVPSKIITNRDLEQIVDTNDEWIRSRTGIEERHVAADPKETTATLAIAAARKALEVADVHPSKVDLVICATSSPEYMPSMPGPLT